MPIINLALLKKLTLRHLPYVVRKLISNKVGKQTGCSPL